MEKIDWTIIGTIVAVAVALYGAALSTYNLIIKRKEGQRQVTVKLTWGVVGTREEPQTVFFLEAANPGKRNVTLKGCCIQLPNKKELVMPGAQGTINFPHELEEGKSCLVWFPVNEVARLLINEGYAGNVTIRAIDRDAVGGEYTSSPFSGDASIWIKY